MPAPAHSDALFAVYPRPARQDCSFYHSFDLAEGEVVGRGSRQQAAQYLGDVNLAGSVRCWKSARPAAFCRFTWKAKAPKSPAWSRRCPICGTPCRLKAMTWPPGAREFTAEIQEVRNSFWYVHHQKQSRVRLVETDPYAIPAAAGQFDVGLLASVLLHCRRPFDLLESVARRTERTMIITEIWNPTLGEGPVCMLLPHQGMKQVHTWWHFTPQFFISALGIWVSPKTRGEFAAHPAPARRRP